MRHARATFSRHPACRRAVRWTVRQILRTSTRGRPCGPDDLGEALACFRRALRSHRRLARLAPRFFDSVVVERERREREARRRWMDLWEPALAKVYGPSSKPPRPDPDLPPLPSLKIQRKVDLELAACESWLAAGRLALAKHLRRRPHALASLNRLVRLLEVATDLRRLAVGCDPGSADLEPDTYDQALADLERAYGHRCGSVGPDPQPEPPSPPTGLPAPAGSRL